jgi:hypothetical protein
VDAEQIFVYGWVSTLLFGGLGEGWANSWIDIVRVVREGRAGTRGFTSGLSRRGFWD